MTAATPMAPIRLQVTGIDPAGAAWPLTRGVPLPEGAVQQVDELALLDGEGRPVPVQLRPLAHWRDGSLKWVLADFSASASVYELTQLTGVAPQCDAQIQVEETTAAVHVCTGPLRFTVRRDRFGLFEDLRLGDRLLTDGTGAELWARIREANTPVGTRRRIYGMSGECRASLASDAWSVEVEESGPLRTVLTCRGALEMSAPMHHYSGYRPLQFVLRIHAFAGQALLRLQYTVVFCLNPRETEVEELGLRLPLAEWEGRCECRAEESNRTVELGPGGQLLLAQYEDDHYRLESTEGDQTRVAKGERTAGWLTREQGAGGIGVAMQHMAEEYPKALRAQAAVGGLDVMPWHDPQGSRLSLARYAEEVAWHEGEGVYADGTGTAKTTEMAVTWFAAGEASDSIEILSRWLDPPHVAIDSGHMARCEVTGGFAPAADEFPQSERLLSGFVEWLARQIHLGRWYGFFDWGDALVDWDEAAEDWRFRGRWGWCNSEWDPRHGVWIQYLRTGDPALFRLGEGMTRHSVDVDTCHWHAFRPYFVGGGYRHSVDHFGDEPCASHTFVDNWIDHYYLTGDLRTFEVLGEAGEFLRRYRWSEDPRFSFSLRSIANVLRGLLYVYEVTGDESLMQRATQVYEVIARGQNEDGSWHKRFQVATPDRLPEQLPYGMASEGTTFAVELGAPPFTDEEHLELRGGGEQDILRVLPRAEQKGYQTHYLMIGLELLHRLTGRADVADVYQRGVDWFCGAPAPLEARFALQQHYGGILCRHLAYTWRLTGQSQYLEIGRQILARLLATQDWSDDPKRRGSVGMSPMYISLLFFGVPYLLGALKEAGLEELCESPP
jgi:hypothetical protein